MGDILFSYPTAAAPTTELTFNPALVSVTRTRPMPIQVMEVAVSGVEYVQQLSSNIEEIWEVDFDELHQATSGSYAGFDALKSFIQTTVGYMLNTFEVTDADGDSIICRYMRGLADMIEGGGRSRPQSRASQYSGPVLVRKTLT